MLPVRIVIAGTPVAKGRPKIGMGGHGRPVAYTPAKTRQYESEVKFHAVREMAGRPPMDCPVRMHVIVYVPLPKSLSKRKRDLALGGFIYPAKRPDLDNFLKASLDGINQIVVSDDARVVSLTARKLYSLQPRLDILIEPIAEDAA